MKFTNTVALLLSALSASFCICVLEGSTPFASLEIMVRGRLRSCNDSSAFGRLSRRSPFCALRDWNMVPVVIEHPGKLTSTLIPGASRGVRVAAGELSSAPPFVATETLDFRPGIVGGVYVRWQLVL